MRVFMLGWEFPPYISGGLGTACYGLTKALSAQGVDIIFVLPRPIPEPQTGPPAPGQAPPYVPPPAPSARSAPPARPAGSSSPVQQSSSPPPSHLPHHAESPPHATEFQAEPSASSLGQPDTHAGGRAIREFEHVTFRSATVALFDPYTSAERYETTTQRYVQTVREEVSMAAEPAAAPSTVPPPPSAHPVIAPPTPPAPARSAHIPPPAAAAEPPAAVSADARAAVSAHSGAESASAAEAFPAPSPEPVAAPQSLPATAAPPVSAPPVENYNGDLFAQVARYAELCREIAQTEDFDVVHAHDWMTFPAAMSVAAMRGVPIVVHVHSTEFDRAGDNADPRIVEIERRGMHAAIKIIAVSFLTRNQIIRHYGINPPKIEVVYNAIEPVAQTPVVSERYEIRRNEKIVLFLGRITHQKGPEYFLQAAQKVVQVMDNVKFVMAGSGDLTRQSVDLAAKLGIGYHVLFTGFLRGRDVEAIFRMADLYVMPSVSEPFGIAPLEAMSYEVPVLISRQSGVSEVLRHALKVDFWDVDDMADKILAVLRRPPLARELREQGTLEVRRFNWHEAAEACQEIYEQAIAMMRRPAAARRGDLPEIPPGDRPEIPPGDRPEILQEDRPENPPGDRPENSPPEPSDSLSQAEQLPRPTA